MKNGTLTTIESVVILYGSIHFAVFQTGGVYLPSPPPKTSSLSGIASFGASHFELESVPQTSTPLAPSATKRDRDAIEDGEGSMVVKRQRRKKVPVVTSIGTGAFSATMPPLPLLSIATQAQPTHYTPTLDHSNNSNTGHTSGSTPGALSPTVASASAILGSFSSHPLSSSSTQQQLQHHNPYAYQPTMPSYHPPEYPPQLQHTHPLHQSQFSPYPSPDQYNPNAFQTSYAKSPPSIRPQTNEDDPSESDLQAKVPRAKSDTPVNKLGPKACESCGIANSPEWRKGPSGTKSLCNACGSSSS